MEHPKAVFILFLYILIVTIALPTAINGTDQSKNVTEQEMVQETKSNYVNTVQLQDGIYIDLKKSNTNACTCCDDDKKKCNCKHTAANCIYKNKVGTHKNKRNHKENNNCRNKRHGCGCGCDKGKAGNCGQVGNHGGRSEKSSNGPTESNSYEGDKNEPQKSDKQNKDKGEFDGIKTEGNERQKEATGPEKNMDKLNVKQQILKIN